MNSSDKKYIIVYGGTGYYGRKVVEKLINKGEKVKVVSRNIEKAKKILGEKAEISEGDILDPETISKSLKDITAIIICLSAMNPGQIRQMKRIEQDSVFEIMEKADKAGISRLVYMSGYEIREQLLQDLNIIEFGEIKLNVEKKITSSDFNWTILGDAPSYEIFFAFIRNGKMTVPGGGLRAIPCISAEDVGEITAQAVLRNDLKGRRLKLTGPKAYTFPEAAFLISGLSEKKIKHLKIPLPVFNIISIVLMPFNPFLRYLYKTLKMLNNFPVDLADDVPIEHEKLRKLFDYIPVTLENETEKRIASGQAPFIN